MKCIKSLIKITLYVIKGHTTFFLVLQIGIPEESTIILESYLNFDRSRMNCKINVICVKNFPAFQIKLEYGLIIQEKLYNRQQTAGEGFDGPGNLCRGTCCSKYHFTL